MHGVAILLVCVCAAFASKGPVHRREVSKEPETLPEAFVPPPYDIYLRETDETINTVVRHFHPSAYDDVEDKDFRYIILTRTYYELAENVLEYGWSEYNNNYEHLVKEFREKAFIDMREAARQLKCDVLVNVIAAVENVRKVMEDPYVQYICRVQPDACNSVIWAIIHYNHDEDAIRSAGWLETIGPASGVFLREYAKSFEAVSALNVYKYIYLSKDVLRPLVAVNKMVLGEIPRPPNFGCHLNTTIHNIDESKDDAKKA